MSKTRRWVIILLSLLALVLIGFNLVDKDAPGPASSTITTQHIKVSIPTPWSTTLKGR